MDDVFEEDRNHAIQADLDSLQDTMLGMVSHISSIDLLCIAKSNIFTWFPVFIDRILPFIKPTASMYLLLQSNLYDIER